MAIRLNQVTTELNIGLWTVVDFLSKKGFNIKAAINTKLTTEQYKILCEEFSSDAFIKKMAAKRTYHQTNLDDILVLYDSVDTEEKINEIIELYTKSFRYHITEQVLQRLYEISDNNLHSYLKSIYDSQEKVSVKSRKKRKRKYGKVKSPSVFNKNDYIYKRIHIISTPM